MARAFRVVPLNMGCDSCSVSSTYWAQGTSVSVTVTVVTYVGTEVENIYVGYNILLGTKGAF